jgi:nitrous oxidase accessory protein NosD
MSWSRDSEAFDVDTDSFDDDPYDPTELIDDDDEF